jgi:alpha-L-fucosidase
MKKSIYCMTLAITPLLALAAVRAADNANTLDPAYRHASPEAYERWRDLKYGLRIHWGVYSMLGVEASWPLRDMSNQKKQEYQDLYKKFNPTDFDAEKWMQLFERCGLKCFAFTTKHHDGFSLYDTKTRVKRRVNWVAPGGPKIEDCDLAYSIMETPFKRDIVKELCDAAHKHNIAVDLYFSHIDWYDADFRFDDWNPLRAKNYNNRTDPESYARFVQRHRGQIREILGNYGKVEMACLDMHLPDFCWPDIKQTVMMARQLQPDVLLRNRGIGAYGDYHTPEGWVPDSPASRESKSPWMVIYPLGGPFAYQPNGSMYKPGSWILSNLIDITAKGGVFQVAIGPDEKGNFHPEAIKRLECVGDWLKVNGEAIYATRPRDGQLWKQGGDIRFTRSKDNKTIYAICLKWPGKTLILDSVRPEKGSTVAMLGVSEPLVWQFDERKGVTIKLPESLQNQKNRPCENAWAIKIRGETFAAAAAVPSGNSVENGSFTNGEVGQLPTGWTVSAPNPALAPDYKLVKGDDGKNLLLVQGNGRKECFGILRHRVDLPSAKTYRFRVRFRFEGFDDVNRHLVHGVFTGENDGIFAYHKDGQWVVGEGRVALSGKGDVRLYFRYAPKGKVWYSEVSLVECEPIKPRPVKIAVTSGGGDRKRWEKFLDTAGAKHCDVALMGEFFEGGIHTSDDPTMKFMSEKAQQWKMYVCGSIRMKRGDVIYNSAPLFDRQGKLVGIYDKVMLYDPELDDGSSPGENLPVFQADFGKVGIMTCYDSWHPAVAKLLALKGAEVILFPSMGYYMQLMHARAADNGVVIAATSGSPCGVWDGGGNQADKGSPDATRYAPTAIVAFEKDDGQKMQIVTVDLSKKPSPHYWGGPMLSAPGGRRVRATSPWHLEDEISREVRRWSDEP